MAGRSVHQTLIVIRKELRDSLRDRRALFSIAFSIVVGPVLIGFMMNRIADRQREADNVTIPVVGQQHAPAFVEWLRQQAGVTVIEGPSRPEQAVRDGTHDVVVVIADDYAEKFSESRPATVKVVADTSRNSARPSIERVRRLLQRYSAEIGALRLISRGVSPAGVTPLKLEEIEISTAQQRAAQVLSFIPMFIILAAFVGGMSIATDSTAGRARTRIPRSAARQSGSAHGARRRQVHRGRAHRHDRRGADNGAVREHPAIPAAAGHGHPVPHRPGRIHRRPCGDAADVSVLGVAAGVSRNAGAFVQGGAELYGRAGAAADAARNDQRRVDARTGAMDVPRFLCSGSTCW
jgi:hypothetical protein